MEKICGKGEFWAWKVSFEYLLVFCNAHCTDHDDVCTTDAITLSYNLTQFLVAQRNRISNSFESVCTFVTKHDTTARLDESSQNAVNSFSRSMIKKVRVSKSANDVYSTKL